MSCVPVDAAAEVCSNCGKEGSDTIKLKNCTACFLVKYCGVDCQKSHRKLHKKACKQRAAELKDEKLYNQGHERPEGDFCPICVQAIPFPIDKHAAFYACCMKRVCYGCGLAAQKRGLDKICPFCRSPLLNEAFSGVLEKIQKRVDARDPESICYHGSLHLIGAYGLDKDESKAIEMWSEAADLGSTMALSKLGRVYYHGIEVAQYTAKAVRFWESAAMRGCAESRTMLGVVELENGNYDRAVRHFLISAKMGHKDSFDAIKDMFPEGLATKAQYAEALKGYQDAVEEMKSPERDEAVNTGFSSNR